MRSVVQNCSVLLRNISRAVMSKKCKIDIAKKTANSMELSTSAAEDMGNHINLTKHLTGNLQGEDINNIHRLPTPVKSANDKKNYAVIRLPNGLTALLVSDESSDKTIPFNEPDLVPEESDEENSANESSDSDNSASSEPRSRLISGSKNDEKLAACSLTVGVGSFSDPSDIPGLAHFLEHMLFMGSTKYPKENEFDSYIKKHGGSDNASTECEYTTFYFECQVQFMPKAMDIFSQFFISPLIKKEAMTREREAVESEFTMAQPNDSFRRQQLLSSTAVTGNPGGKFLWGNLITLRDNVTDDYLHETVHKFWERHYSAHRMTLTVQARAPLETLEKWVVKCFSDVPCNNLPPLDYMSPIVPFNHKMFNKLYYVESVSDLILLELNWPMPPVKHLYNSKPTNYLSWIIGHEGKGSLVAYLRRKLWALGLTAGHNEDGLANNSIYSLFTITVYLTENGLKNHLNDVLDSIFSYIKMLQINGPEERIFREIQNIAEIDFRFDEETSAIENVETLSESMQFYPPVHYIVGEELYFDYEPAEIKRFLKCLSPSTVNIMLSKKHHDPSIIMDKTEPWFNTRYTFVDIPKTRMEKWEHIHPYDEFHMPEANNFIASDFTILNKEEAPTYPEKILSSEALSIWYKPDTKFKLPVGFIGFQIVNKSSFESLEANVALHLYTDLINHLFVEELYPAIMALLEYSIVVNDRALIIEVYGFNEKLHVLLEKITEYMCSFNNMITEDILTAFKETNIKNQYNVNLKVSELGKELRLSTLFNTYFTTADRYNIYPHVTLEKVKDYSTMFFKKTHIQCLVQGNLLRDEALSICKNFVNKLNLSGLPEIERPRFRIHQLPIGEKCCRIQAFNKSDSNCITVNYYQMGIGHAKEYCSMDLLIMLLEEPLFDTLRTQEQLGYDVNIRLRDTYGIIGFTVTVVSQIDKFSVDHVEERITSFLRGYVQTLKEMPLSEFNGVKQALISLKQCCDLHLKEEIKRNWAEIKTFAYAFDRLEREQEVLATLKPQDIIDLLEVCTDPNSPNYRKLIVQVVGYNNKMEVNEAAENKETSLPSSLIYSYIDSLPDKPDNYFINDINEFKSKLPLYPENKVFDA